MGPRLKFRIESIAACYRAIVIITIRNRGASSRGSWIFFRFIAFFFKPRDVMHGHERRIGDAKSSIPSGTRDNARDVSGIDRQPSRAERIVTFDKQSSPLSLPLNR